MEKKIGRNDPCLCGSGKKYKNCCINKSPLAKKIKHAVWINSPKKESVENAPHEGEQTLDNTSNLIERAFVSAPPQSEDSSERPAKTFFATRNAPSKKESPETPS